MSLILALDGALACASAAVVRDGTVLAHRRQEGERGQAAALPPMVAAVLAEAGVAATALDAVGVTVGPGSFTGLRAALSLAQGLALASSVPVRGVTTGEALTAALPEAGAPVWALIDTKRGRVVLERFGSASPEAFDIGDLPEPPAGTRLVGDAVALLGARWPQAVRTGIALPDAAAVAAVVVRDLAERRPPRPAMPLYVEPPAVALPA